MSASAYPLMVDALAAALSLRVGLDGVAIFTAPATPEDLGTRSIMFSDEVDIQRAQAAMSSMDYAETFTLGGWVTCTSPMKSGANRPDTVNAAAKVSRDAAFAIISEVNACLAADQTVSGTVLGCDLTTLKVQQGLAPEGQLGRWCAIQFSIEAEAHTAS